MVALWIIETKVISVLLAVLLLHLHEDFNCSKMVIRWNQLELFHLIHLFFSQCRPPTPAWFPHICWLLSRRTFRYLLPIWRLVVVNGHQLHLRHVVLRTALESTWGASLRPLARPSHMRILQQEFLKYPLDIFLPSLLIWLMEWRLWSSWVVRLQRRPWSMFPRWISHLDLLVQVGRRGSFSWIPSQFTIIGCSSDNCL